MFTLNITNSAQALAIITQIDASLPMVFSGSPIGVVACGKIGTFGTDELTGDVYRCTATDGSGEASGTSWEQVFFSITVGTVDDYGIFKVAQLADIIAGTATDKVITASLASLFAKSGENADITSLGALEGPIGVGAYGKNTLSDLLTALLPAQTGNGGKLLQTDGTSVLWVTSELNVTTVSSGALSANSINILTASAAYTLPAANVGDYVSLYFSSAAVNSTISSPSSSKILGQSDTVVIDDTNWVFNLVYAGATYGWIQHVG